MKLLVLAGAAVSAAQIRDAAGGADPSQSEVMVIAPALHESGLRFWVSDADEAIARAEEVRRETVAGLEASGARPRSDTGEGDLEQAIVDALQTFSADRVVIFTSPEAAHYREDVDADALAERLGVPVTRVGL